MGTTPATMDHAPSSDKGESTNHAEIRYKNKTKQKDSPKTSTDTKINLRKSKRNMNTGMKNHTNAIMEAIAGDTADITAIQTKCDKVIKQELIESNETVNIAEHFPKLPKVINIESESVNNDEQNDSSNDETSAITYETHKRKATKRTRKHKRTRLEMEELLYCSSIAKVRKWSSTNGTYEVWRDRNPKLLPNLTPVTLSNMRRTVERRFSSKHKDKILRRAEKEVREFKNKLT